MCGIGFEDGVGACFMEGGGGGGARYVIDQRIDASPTLQNLEIHKRDLRFGAT
jgi:hypothetical protein